MQNRVGINAVIDEAARRTKMYLVEKAGGRIPRTEKALRRLAADVGFHLTPTHHCPRSFTAHSFYVKRLSRWIGIYNANASQQEKRRMMIHEISEYLVYSEFASLFDDLNHIIGFAYDGAGNPKDIRHRIAQRVEQLCFRRSRKLT